MSHPDQPQRAHSWVRILERHVDYKFAGLFRVIRARLQHRLQSGKGMSAPLTRISFERGDSVAVLLYDPHQDLVVLVRQFRYPVYEGLAPEDRRDDGARRDWILETVAGVKGVDDAVTIANRELFEEAGYEVDGGLRPLGIFYVSPGGTSERIHLFVAEVDQHSRAGAGGGLEEEGEDIEVVSIPFMEAMEMVRSGAINDAKTIIALQHIALSGRSEAGRQR